MSELTFAVFSTKIDSVNVFAVFNTGIVTERDFKSGNLFRMCFVVTNPVTLLDFKPVRCATTLCQFGLTQNSYVATHFILLSSTEGSSATSCYVVVSERYGQNEESANRNEERTRNRLSFAHRVDLIDATWKHMKT